MHSYPDICPHADGHFKLSWTSVDYEYLCSIYEKLKTHANQSVPHKSQIRISLVCYGDHYDMSQKIVIRQAQKCPPHIYRIKGGGGGERLLFP